MAVADKALGPYQLEEVLGRGGQATVYRARDTRLGRTVAVKALPLVPGTGSRARLRWDREAAIAARLVHECLCPVHDVGVDGDLAWIAMGYVPGRTLADHIEASRHDLGDAAGSVVLPLAATDAALPRAAVALIERVARAAHVAHEAGIIHRDLKPANIMVTPEGAPVVLDFGLAGEDMGDGASRLGTTTLVGTPAYLAPELIERAGARPDRRSDVYALGATLFECVTLRPPFARPTAESLYQAVLTEACPDPRAINASVSRDLAAIVGTCLAREQDDRYQTALDLAEDLARLDRGEPVRARAPGPLRVFSSWCRRRPRLAAAVTGFFAVTILALGVVTSLLGQTRQALADTQRVADVLGLPQLLAEEADGHWPARAAGLPQLDARLVEAEAMAARELVHRQTLNALRASGTANASGTWIYPDADVQRQHDELAAHVARLAELARIMDAVRARRLEGASLAARTIDAHRQLWEATTTAVAASPRHPGLILPPQEGLVPLGPDPLSGLFEFAHLPSGEVPRRDPDTGALDIDVHSAIVFVLVPGGRVRMGAVPPSDENPLGSPHVDPHRTYHDDEHPVHEATLAPYFLSKYELTRGQWWRLSGMPMRGTARWADQFLRLPVQNVSWFEADAFLRRAGLQLPTEFQWVGAARAGTTTIWWTGDDPEELKAAENLYAWEDGYTGPAPVGVFAPNPFGFHDVLGNVIELVADRYGSFELPVRDGDGLRQVPDDRFRVLRGGYSDIHPRRARSAIRALVLPEAHSGGVRPARSIDPP